jgi:hypothetical protein
LREKRSACVHCAPDWKTRIGEDVTSRILDRVQGATKKNTSETLVLQRYAEIVPSVNRTAVSSHSNSQAWSAGGAPSPGNAIKRCCRAAARLLTFVPGHLRLSDLGYNGLCSTKVARSLNLLSSDPVGRSGHGAICLRSLTGTYSGWCSIPLRHNNYANSTGHANHPRNNDGLCQSPHRPLPKEMHSHRPTLHWSLLCR